MKTILLLVTCICLYITSLMLFLTQESMVIIGIALFTMFCSGVIGSYLYHKLKEERK